MTRAGIGAGLILALAACGGGPPDAIPAEGAAVDVVQAARFVHHQGEAREIAFTPDGGTMIATGTDGRIELMRGIGGPVAGRLQHPDGANSLALSPDGSMLVSGGYDRTARIWRLADRQMVRILTGAGGTIWSVAWSPDGRTIATAGEDRMIRLWNAGDGTLLRTLAGHELNIWSVRFSPDSRLLASGSFDHSVRLWDVASGAMIRRLRGHDEAAVSVAWSPDGRLLASGGDDSTLRIWRVADGAQIAALTGDSEHIYAVAFSPDGRWLASGGRAHNAIGTFWHQLTGGLATGNAVRLWRVGDQALQATLEDSDDVMALAFSPDSRLLVTGAADGTNTIWRLTPR